MNCTLSTLNCYDMDMLFESLSVHSKVGYSINSFVFTKENYTLFGMLRPTV